MSVNPHDPETCITLSPAILAHLKSKSMSPGALKVYIYLCARYTGRSFSASTTQLKEATGLEDRSVIAAVKVLCEENLITRTSQGGNRPNEFAILLPKSQQTTTPQTEKAMLPSSGLKQPTPAASTSAETAKLEQIIATPEAKPNQAVKPAPTPRRPTILEQISASYRSPTR